MDDPDDFAVRLVRRFGLDPDSVFRRVRELCEEDLVPDSLMRGFIEADYRETLEDVRHFEVTEPGERPVFRRTLSDPDDAVALEFRIYAHLDRVEEILEPHGDGLAARVCRRGAPGQAEPSPLAPSCRIVAPLLDHFTLTGRELIRDLRGA